MNYNVQILDQSHNHIADFMNASTEDVLKFIRKGMIVINLLTGSEMHEEDLVASICIQECAISM
jgi:hypothetical protein